MKIAFTTRQPADRVIVAKVERTVTVVNEGDFRKYFAKEKD